MLLGKRRAGDGRKVLWAGDERTPKLQASDDVGGIVVTRGLRFRFNIRITNIVFRLLCILVLDRRAHFADRLDRGANQLLYAET